MSGMVERVARVLHHWQAGHDRWDEADPLEREDAMEAARAAITAMREPTGEMAIAADELKNPSNYSWWQAMIDEALKP